RRAGRRTAQPGPLARDEPGLTTVRSELPATMPKSLCTCVKGSSSMRIGVLTGGGDCPGLNAVIRAVVRKGISTYGHEFVGFRDGWRGPLEGFTRELGVAQVRGILPRVGTILGPGRT